MLQVSEIKGKHQGTKVKSLLSTYLQCIPLSKLCNTLLIQFLHCLNGANNTVVSFRGVIRCFESFEIGRRHQAMKMQRTVMLKTIHRNICNCHGRNQSWSRVDMHHTNRKNNYASLRNDS